MSWRGTSGGKGSVRWPTPFPRNEQQPCFLLVELIRHARPPRIFFRRTAAWRVLSRRLLLPRVIWRRQVDACQRAAFIHSRPSRDSRLT